MNMPKAEVLATMNFLVDLADNFYDQPAPESDSGPMVPRFDAHVARATIEAMIADHDRVVALINNPEFEAFLRGVHVEAVHQVERWGQAHDRAKRPADWFWLVGYLAGKALHSATGEQLPRYRHVKRGSTYEIISVGEDENNRGTQLVVYRGEDDGKIWVRPADQFFDGRFEQLSDSPLEKALHHCISSAAALYNWHCAIKGVDVRMCPGRSDLAEMVDSAFPGEADGGVLDGTNRTTSGAIGQP